MGIQSRILLSGSAPELDERILEILRQNYVLAQSEPWSGTTWQTPPADVVAVLAVGESLASAARLAELRLMLDSLPDGIAILDHEFRLRWWNTRFARMARVADLEGADCLEAFGQPDIEGSELTPIGTAFGSGRVVRSTLRMGDKQFYELIVSPIFILATSSEKDGTVANANGVYPHQLASGAFSSARTPAVPVALSVTVRDISSEILHRQKLNAIHQAGLELGELSTDDLADTTIEDRTELLKQKIVLITQTVLEFETVEIRLLDRATNRLDPLLNVGMTPEAANRELFASEENNGVTGWVAATGRSYMCADTTNDRLYLQGALGARSSLTVPLILHDEVQGTLNVEGSQPGTFQTEDLQFLELFGREVAVALNTLDLLVAEKQTTVNQSTEMILREVALPLNSILNDAAWIKEVYMGHSPEVLERLQRLLDNVRGIRQLIHKVGDTIRPSAPGQTTLPPQGGWGGKRKRILVVDNDVKIMQAANDLLARFGYDVESATTGNEGTVMMRTAKYDAVLADIRLPDTVGFECVEALRKVNTSVPLILMTSYGYDPLHTIVKARQAGIKHFLYKPFRLDQMLEQLQKATTEDPAS